MARTKVPTEIQPRLVLDRVDDAIAFYRAVFGAELLERFVGPDGVIVHAGIRIGASTLSLTEGLLDRKARTRPAAGGSVLLHLTLPDPDAACARLVERGGKIVIPIQDQVYGKREGRVEDPFGHLWILSRPVEELSADEIQRRLEGL